MPLLVEDLEAIKINKYTNTFNLNSILSEDSSYEEPTITRVGSMSGDNKWYGGVLAPNGRIYGIPRDATNILEIDPMTHTTALLASYTGQDKWAGGVLAPNGKIFGIPGFSYSLLTIDTHRTPKDPTMCLSPYFNKF